LFQNIAGEGERVTSRPKSRPEREGALEGKKTELVQRTQSHEPGRKDTDLADRGFKSPAATVVLGGRSVAEKSKRGKVKRFAGRHTSLGKKAT